MGLGFFFFFLLRARGIYFANCFRAFTSCSREGTSGTELLNSWWTGSREKGTGRNLMRDKKFTVDWCLYGRLSSSLVKPLKANRIYGS